MRIGLIALLLIAGTANAETFKCKSGTYWDSSKVVVIATINKDGVSGTIKVAGVTHQAKYHVEGFDRRWNFGLQDDLTFDFAFVMEPSGLARYYDFPKQSVDDMRTMISKALSAADRGNGVLILTDMFGGTPSNMSLSFVEEGGVEVVTGLNLPMLVKLATFSEENDLQELAAFVKNYGQRNISVTSEILPEKETKA